MPEDERAEAGDEVDVAISVDVEDVRVFAARIDDRALRCAARLFACFAARIERRAFDGGNASGERLRFRSGWFFDDVRRKAQRLTT